MTCRAIANRMADMAAVRPAGTSSPKGMALRDAVSSTDARIGHRAGRVEQRATTACPGSAATAHGSGGSIKVVGDVTRGLQPAQRPQRHGHLVDPALPAATG